MRMSVLGLPIILALSLLQLPGALSAFTETNFVTAPSFQSPTLQQARQRQLPQQSQQQQQPQQPQQQQQQQQQPQPQQQQQQSQVNQNQLNKQQVPLPRPILFDPPASSLALSPSPLALSSSSSSSSSSSASAPTTEKKKSKETDAQKAAKKARKAAQRAHGGEGMQYFYTGPIRKYNLIFPPGALDTLRAKPFTEEWAPCSIEVDFGTPYVSRYDGCGCRYKGSVGSLRMCIDRVTGQPNGACRKLSWKVDAARYLEPGPNGEKPTQRIKGVKELGFGGLPVDLSLLTERLSAGLLKNSGIIGFRANYALLNINGNPDGVYSLLELPGDLFTQDRWAWDEEKGDGALYKEALFRDDSDLKYFKDHRVSGTNEDDWMLEVNNAILNATTDAAKHLVLDTYFDTKSFVDVTAFNTVIGNTDDWRQRHNFLWYVLTTPPTPEVAKKPLDDTSTQKKPKKVKKLVLVPSDYDRINDGNTLRGGLGKAPKHWYDPISPDLCTQVDQSPEQRAARQPPAEYEYWVSLFSQYPPNVGKPINCDQFAKVFSVLAKRVNQRIVELATGPMAASAVGSLMSQYAAQIQHLPGQDPDPPNQPEWEEGKTSLRNHLDTARAAALAEAKKELARVDSEATSKAIPIATPATPPPFLPPPKESVPPPPQMPSPQQFSPPKNTDEKVDVAFSSNKVFPSPVPFMASYSSVTLQIPLDLKTDLAISSSDPEVYPSFKTPSSPISVTAYSASIPRAEGLSTSTNNEPPVTSYSASSQQQISRADGLSTTSNKNVVPFAPSYASSQQQIAVSNAGPASVSGYTPQTSSRANKDFSSPAQNYPPQGPWQGGPPQGPPQQSSPSFASYQSPKQNNYVGLPMFQPKQAPPSFASNSDSTTSMLMSMLQQPKQGSPNVPIFSASSKQGSGSGPELQTRSMTFAKPGSPSSSSSWAPLLSSMGLFQPKSG